MEDHIPEGGKSGTGAVPNAAFGSPARVLAYASVTILLTFLAWMYATTFMSMIRIWIQSDTFAHGFAVLPISAYLIWKARRIWLHRPVRPSLVGFALLFFLVLAWLVSSLANIQVGRQLAVTGMLGAIVWTVLGTRVAREISFPLLFANFAAPFGSFLVPPLMEWTAGFTVWAVSLTGIPVFREGMNFWLPGSTFSVIEACSGSRYLLVAVVLGALFSHIAYRDWRKRALFMAAAIVMSIIANGFRAYSIVLMVHYSDHRYGMGYEHFIVGWIIYSALLLMLFIVGSKFSDGMSFNATRKHSFGSVPAHISDAKLPIVFSTFAAVLSLLSIAPYLVERIQFAEHKVLHSPTLPVGVGEWSGPTIGGLGNYRPIIEGASVTLGAVYDGSGGRVGLYEFVYQNERQGVELINWQNQLFDSDRWILRDEFRTSVSRPGYAELEVESVLITDRQTGDALLVWTWYDVNGVPSSGKYEAKFQQAWQRATFRNNISAQIVLSTHAGNDDAIEAQARLEVFVHEYAERLSSCYRVVIPGDAECVEPR